MLPMLGQADEIHPVLMFENEKRSHSAADSSLAFSAMGKDFRIHLTRSPLLSARLSQHEQLPELLQGTVEGYDNSWARISISNGEPSGYIWLENQLYQLTLSSQLSINMPDRAKPTSKWVLVQPDDLPNMRMASGNPGDKAVTRAIKIGIVIDTQFDLWHQGRGLAKALEIINGVDGLYQQQLGVAVVIDSILELNTLDTDPLLQIEGTLEEVLLGFRRYRSMRPDLIGSVSLVHLFSGHRDAENIVGLGWIDTVCRTDGYDLSVSTPFAFDVLLSAHEIAHNLGALHDDDPRCEGSVLNNDTLMVSTLNSNTTATLSNCSLNNIRPAIGRSCNLDNIDLAHELRSIPIINERLGRTVVLKVSNMDAQRTARRVETRTEFPNGTNLSGVPASCTLDQGALVCTHTDIPAFGESSLSLTASFPDEQNRRITSTIQLNSLSDINQLNNRVSIDALEIIPGQEIAQADSTQNGAGAGSSTSALGRIDYLLLLILITVCGRYTRRT